MLLIRKTILTGMGQPDKKDSRFKLDREARARQCVHEIGGRAVLPKSRVRSADTKPGNVAGLKPSKPERET